MNGKELRELAAAKYGWGFPAEIKDADIIEALKNQEAKDEIKITAEKTAEKTQTAEAEKPLEVKKGWPKGKPRK